MKRSILAGLALALTATPAMADAKAPTHKHTVTYLKLYRQARRAFGVRAPGCKLIAPRATCHQAVSDAAVTKSIGVLLRMLTPAPAIATATSTPSQVSSGQAVSTSTASPGGGGSGSLPSCTWQPESGGNWTAYNPSSGAGGYYQITPGTWAANGGTGSPQSASPAEQTQVAERVWATQGPSAWVNC